MIEYVTNVEENDFLSTDFVDNEIKNNPYAKFIVYKINNKIVGYLYYSLIYDRIEINQIEVIESERNKRIGSQLLEFLIKKEKLDITLEVKKNNFFAIKLYKKYGFKEVAIRKGYYNGIDGILMERKSR